MFTVSVPRAVKEDVRSIGLYQHHSSNTGLQQKLIVGRQTSAVDSGQAHEGPAPFITRPDTKINRQESLGLGVSEALLLVSFDCHHT